MSHIEEYKNSKTIYGWQEEEAEMHENIFIRLALKDAKGQATNRDKIAIEIDQLLKYNNVELPTAEVFQTVDKILQLK